MDFQFQGLDEPIRLPDGYLSVAQYERLQRFLHQHQGEPEDFRYVRECLAEVLSVPDFLARTDELPMSPSNLAQWEAVNNHLAGLLMGSSKVGDDLTNQAVSDPLAQAPTEPAENPTNSGANAS